MVELTLCEESLSFPASRWKLLYHTLPFDTHGQRFVTTVCNSSLTWLRMLFLGDANALLSGSLRIQPNHPRWPLTHADIHALSLLDSHLQLHMCVLSPSIASALVVLLQTVLVAIRPLAAVPRAMCVLIKRKRNDI
jgi:hypothetical protein